MLARILCHMLQLAWHSGRCELILVRRLFFSVLNNDCPFCIVVPTVRHEIGRCSFGWQKLSKRTFARYSQQGGKVALQ